MSRCLDLSRLKKGRYSREIESLESLLSGRRVAVGYSGGVDSTLLAVLAREFSEASAAITVVSPLLSKRDLQRAKSLAAQLGLRHFSINMNLLSEPAVKRNLSDRCYHCKRSIYSRLIEEARKMGLEAVLDGSNADDILENRPGLKAVRELGIETPLAQVGLGKAAVREISRRIGLPTWNQPSNSCLATRIPSGRPLTLAGLSRVERAESLLAALGYQVFRVRDHGDIARVELGPDDLGQLDLDKLASQIVDRFREIGYRRVCVDLSPYRHPEHHQSTGRRSET